MFTSSLSRGRGVAVRIGHEGRRIDNVFVRDHSVLLGTGSNFEAFGVRLAREETEVRYGHVAAFPVFQRVADLAQDVVANDPVVELLGPSDVQGEPSYFNFDFTLVCLVAVILGSGRGQFDDLITVLQFFSHVTQVDAQRDVGLARFPAVDDVIRAQVQGLLLELFQVAVQLESSPAGGEGGHEAISLAVVQLILVLVGEDDFQFLVGAHANARCGCEADRWRPSR